MGATGSQGGGLVRAILNDKDGGYSARAITRNVNSGKAKELARLGAEVVPGDVDDEVSLKRAFDGAYGVYCVHFLLGSIFLPKRNLLMPQRWQMLQKKPVYIISYGQRLKIPVNGCRLTTTVCRHSWANTRYPHFDAKGEADHIFTDIGLPVTLLHTSFYWDNLIYFGMGPKKGTGRAYSALPCRWATKSCLVLPPRT